MKPLQLHAFLFLVVAAIFAVPMTAWAQVAPSLGNASEFAVVGGTTVTNTGPSVIQGSVGVSPGSAVTGFPPGIVIGETHAADVQAAGAQADLTTAYNALAAQGCDTTFSVPTDLGGMVLVPGVYCFASSASLTGALTLDGEGNPSAVFIFKTGSTLITASASSVLLINGASPCNVFWQVGSSATLGTASTFSGNILALTSIALNTNATLFGRALARNGEVTLDSNPVALSTCAVTDGGVGDGGVADGGMNGGGGADGGVTDGGVADGGVQNGCPPVPPTLEKCFSPATIYTGGLSTLTITLRNANPTRAVLTAPLVDSMPTGVMVAGAASTTCGGMVTTSSSTVTLAGAAIPANGSCTVTVAVSATVCGYYLNTLPVGALQSSNGSNTRPAEAVLTVLSRPVPPPTVTRAPVLQKSFSPASIVAGGSSTLTITLHNPNARAAALTQALTDFLPQGMVVRGSASTTCGGALTAGPGGSRVVLSGGSIPASGSCTVTVQVTVNRKGTYKNKLAVGALKTDQGHNSAPAYATLTVRPSVRWWRW